MTILEISLISIGLAMDCFAVSIASSIAYGRYNWAKMLRMAFFFAFFQGAMPFIGWLAGVSFAEQITRIDHWLAFVILAYLGGKMIYGSLKKKQEDVCCDKNTPFGSLKMLIILSFATSIDALATGLIFVPFGNLIYTAVGIIALGSFLFTIVGCVIVISVAAVILFAPARIYGHITDKRSGSDFLMLPASHLEKWISMVLITCVELPVVLIVTLGACDSVLGLIFPKAYGSPIVSSIASAKEFIADNLSDSNVNVHANFVAMGIFSWIESILIFTLGAICLQQSKVAKTILADLLAGTILGSLFTLFWSPECMLSSVSEMTDMLTTMLNVILNVVYGVVICGLLVATYFRVKTIKQ